MQDIKDVLDAELRTPPAPTFDVAATLGPGRRAVRRRRLAAGGAALALALVVGGAGVAVTSQFAGSQGADPVQVAAGVSDEGLASTEKLVDESPAGYDPQDDDVILVRSGWEVVERVEDPVTGMSSTNGGGPITDSTALALRKGATTTWVVLFRFAKEGTTVATQGGGGVAETEAESGYDTLAGWLDHQRTLTFTGTAR